MTVSTDALTDEVAAAIDKWLWSAGQNGPVIAAWAVLALPDIADALQAARRLERLTEAHTWVDRPGESTWRSCSCGTAGCRLPDLLADDNATRGAA